MIYCSRKHGFNTVTNPSFQEISAGHKAQNGQVEKRAACQLQQVGSLSLLQTWWSFLVFVSQQIFSKMHLNKYKLMNWMYLHELTLNVSPTWKTQLGKKKDYLSNTFLVGMISMLIKLYCSWFKVVYLMNLFIPSGISHEPVYNQLIDLLFRPLRAMASCPLVFWEAYFKGRPLTFQSWAEETRNWFSIAHEGLQITYQIYFHRGVFFNQHPKLKLYLPIRNNE